ncbi:Ig-like domain-containing protein [Pyxidicoccus sp. 3LG]
MRRATSRTAPLVLLASMALLLSGCGDDSFKLLSTWPADGATGVPRDSTVYFTFNREVDFPLFQPSPEVTITPEADVEAYPGSPLLEPGVWKLVIVRPTASLAPDTEYVVTVRARSVDGETASASVRFVTGREPIPESELPPEVTLVPSEGATDVAIDAKLEFTFSRVMDPASVEQALSFEPAATCEWAWEPRLREGDVATCTPNPPLALDTLYTVRLAASAHRDAGGGRLAGDLVRTFRTHPAPTLTGVVPAPGARAVPRQSTVQLTFSREMRCPSVQQAFRLLGPGDSRVEGALECPSGASSTYVFKPRSFLESGEYRWVLDAGVLDRSGSPTAAAASGSFTVARLGVVTLGVSPGGSATVSNQGSIVGDSEVLRVGVDAEGVVHRAFFTFALSELPGDVVRIDEAVLLIRPREVVGNPYGTYGRPRVDYVSVGELDAADFQALPYLSQAYEATDVGNGVLGAAVGDSVRAAFQAREPAWFRLAFFFAGFRGVPHYVDVGSALAAPELVPTLTVTYQYP